MKTRDGLQPFRTLRQAYGDKVERGEMTRDPAQEPLVAAFDRLIEDVAAKRLAAKSSSLGWLFGRKRQTREPVRGLYIHGGVGRGKTMLMDMFFELVPVRRKRRVHFNDFMAEVHDRIGRHRAAVKAGTAKGDDPIPPVARDLAEQSWVLCFDEFSVTDIADAMILSRLFSALFDEGVVLVATSNVAPDDLYRDGLNRPLFTPFIAILKRHAQILFLDADTDYRLEKLDGVPVYMHPIDAANEHRFDEAWRALVDGSVERADEVVVKGRHVPVPRAVRDAARFAFADLCEKPLAARDYLAIADRYRTIFLGGIPVMDDSRRNEAKRFILLVDTLYDRKVRLVATAQAAPTELYRGRIGAEAFEFDRTASRLIEMQSEEWRDAWEAASATQDSNGALAVRQDEPRV
ncbi:cell division protein ZapE [Aquibium carbonis]|uniref:Cell division protein ZapE n=1 Tax=Aquibium carbonis TaxID=2495581 RepID=A0A429Z3G1_9HYPH|nr:cell division protein ZapE [Aquibium carbonis]RST88261.1 cell division protein ZapE [Aquibium carbonis]